MKKHNLSLTIVLLSTALVAFQNCTIGFNASNGEDSSVIKSGIVSEPEEVVGPNDLVYYDSSIANSTSKLRIFNSSNVIFSLNKIENETLELSHLDGTCDFAELKKKGSRDWPLHCQWSLQIFAATQKAYSFFTSIGVTMPPKIFIQSQDAESRCFANAGGNSMSLCKFDDKFMTEQMAGISPVVYHEIAHIVQGEGKAQFITARLGGLQEDHATLFSYLLSGQTNYLNSHDGPQMKIYDEKVPFGWRGSGNYESHIALTSFLIDSHRALLMQTTKDRHVEITRKIGQLYVKILAEASLDDTAQVILNRYMTQYSALLQELSLTNREAFIAGLKKSLMARNLDLDSNELFGHSIVMLAQSLPADVGGTWRSQHVSPETALKPVIEIAGRQANALVDSLLPLEVILIPQDYFAALNACVQEVASGTDIRFVQRDCYRKVGGASIAVKNGTVTGTSKVLSKVGDKLEVNFTPAANCSGTDFIFAKTFDGQGKEVISFPVILGCGT